MTRPHGYEQQLRRLDDQPFGQCSCGKLRWRSRRAAKAAISHMRGRYETSRLKVYRCLFEPAWFHIGHQPDALAAGEIGRQDIAPKPSTPRRFDEWA